MKLLFLGDFFYDYTYISDDIEQLSKWIKENNINTILNLEGTIDSEKFSKINKRGPNLSGNKTSIDILKMLNVVGVTIANNHIMDFEKQGLINTIKLLDDNNIKHTGAGINIEEACKPIIISAGENEIAILGFGWNVEETVYASDLKAGCVPRDEKIILNEIKQLKEKYSKLIVMPHWGFEYNRLPMPYDVEFAHKMIDNGCDLIIGSHPHCVQPIEIYNGKEIYYSLGNFYFSSKRSEFNKKFREKIDNQSDYGIGVITDFNLNNDIVTLYYDKNKNTTIQINNDNNVLCNINNYNKDKRSYYRNVKKMKKNINPILTNNHFLNFIKIKKLYLYYFLKSILKSILRIKK